MYRRHVPVLIVLVAALVAIGEAAGSSHANPQLVATVGVGDAFVITLADAAGAPVTHLPAGTYDIAVHDGSELHNFHLSGPGVNVSTPVEFVGDRTLTVTLVDGVYTFVCDPHSSVMKGAFTVGSVTSIPPPPPPPVARPKPKPKKAPLCKRGQHSTKKHPCRKR